MYIALLIPQNIAQTRMRLKSFIQAILPRLPLYRTGPSCLFPLPSRRIKYFPSSSIKKMGCASATIWLVFLMLLVSHVTRVKASRQCFTTETTSHSFRWLILYISKRTSLVSRYCLEI